MAEAISAWETRFRGHMARLIGEGAELSERDIDLYCRWQQAAVAAIPEILDDDFVRLQPERRGVLADVTFGFEARYPGFLGTLERISLALATHLQRSFSAGCHSEN